MVSIRMLSLWTDMLTFASICSYLISLKQKRRFWRLHRGTRACYALITKPDVQVNSRFLLVGFPGTKWNWAKQSTWMSSCTVGSNWIKKTLPVETSNLTAQSFKLSYQHKRKRDVCTTTRCITLGDSVNKASERRLWITNDGLKEDWVHVTCNIISKLYSLLRWCEMHFLRWRKEDRVCSWTRRNTKNRSNSGTFMHMCNK